MQVTGTTFINHAIRAKLGLSLQEYTVMQFLSDCKEKRINPIESSVELIGVEYHNIASVIISLQSTGFLINWLPNHKWTNEFVGDIDKLWAIHPKGTKKTAKERLAKVLKKAPIEELEAKLKAYIASKPKEEFEFLKGLDVWLNPAKEHWNDPIVISTKLKKEDPQTAKFDFFR